MQQMKKSSQGKEKAGFFLLMPATAERSLAQNLTPHPKKKFEGNISFGILPPPLSDSL
jgi:hypothetical protein